MMPYASDRGGDNDEQMREKKRARWIWQEESLTTHTVSSADKKRWFACCGKTHTTRVTMHRFCSGPLSPRAAENSPFPYLHLRSLSIYDSHSLPLIKYSQLVPLNIHLHLPSANQPPASALVRAHHQKPENTHTHTHRLPAWPAMRQPLRSGGEEVTRKKWRKNPRGKKKGGWDGCWGREGKKMGWIKGGECEGPLLSFCPGSVRAEQPCTSIIQQWDKCRQPLSLFLSDITRPYLITV